MAEEEKVITITTDFFALIPIQRMVNKVVNKRLAVNDMDLPEPIEYLLAMQVEFFEFLNELGTWKWWKQSQELNKEKILDELADVIAFFLSTQISVGNTAATMDDVMDEIFADLYKYSAKDIIMNVTASIQDGLPQPSLILMGIAILLAHKTVDATWEEISEAYEKKSQINIDRQNENY